MDTEKVSFPSQAEASKLIVERSGGSEALQDGLDKRNSAMEAVNKARENLGQVAAGGGVEYHVAPNGQVLTAEQADQERQFRADHGHASDETATKI